MNYKMIKVKLRKIGFVVKHHQPEAAELAWDLAQYALSQGAQVLFEKGSGNGRVQKHKSHFRKNTNLLQSLEKIDLVQRSDLVVVLGGDGTFISAARQMGTRSVPVLGINMGQLGFLTETKKSEAMDFFRDLFSKKLLMISERSLLEVTLKRRGKTVFKGPVLNDAVISKGAIARIIGLDVEINGKWMNNIRADGLIVSTPTGSTAYALSAGGPIIEPQVPCLLIAPICPHSLTQRPLVVSDQSHLKITLTHQPGHVLLTLDGQDVVNLEKNDEIQIRKFRKHSLLIASSTNRDYFGLLREKFQFGHRSSKEAPDHA